MAVPLWHMMSLFCGISDMIDGTIARKTKSISGLGARLDSVADSVFRGIVVSN